MSAIVDQIASTQVTADEMRRALEAFSQLSPNDRRDITARALCLIQLFEDETVRRSNMIAAIEWRFEALSLLSDRPELKAWTIPPDPSGMMLTSGVVLEAAAAEPLVVDGERPTFDPDSFFQRLLSLSEGSGEA